MHKIVLRSLGKLRSNNLLIDRLVNSSNWETDTREIYIIIKQTRKVKKEKTSFFNSLHMISSGATFLLLPQ